MFHSRCVCSYLKWLAMAQRSTTLAGVVQLISILFVFAHAANGTWKKLMSFFFLVFSLRACVFAFFCSVVDLPDRFSLFLVMQGIADGRMTVIVFKSNTLFFALWEVTISLILFHTNKWQGLLKIPLGKLANFAFICQFSRWVKKRIAEQSM